MKAYCYYCDKEVDITIKEEFINVNIKGVEVSYIAKVAYCNQCNNEVYLAELDDENIKIANAEYRKKAGIITQEEIEEILSNYNIGAKTLSKLLEWGEATIDRYLKGITPLKLYSDELKKLKNPMYMKELYEAKKEFISEQSKKRLETALKNILENKKIVNVNDVADFFMLKLCEEEEKHFSTLKLQKLIYYSQGWHLAFYDKPLFHEELEAWIHGPVSRTIYLKYQNMSDEEILKSIAEKDGKINVFDIEQVNLLNEIYKVYGMFEGWILREMTHIDKPWKEARKGYEDNERSNEIISKDALKEYFKNIKNILNIHQIGEIYKSLSIYKEVLKL